MRRRGHRAATASDAAELTVGDDDAHAPAAGTLAGAARLCRPCHAFRMPSARLPYAFRMPLFLDALSQEDAPEQRRPHAAGLAACCGTHPGRGAAHALRTRGAVIAVDVHLVDGAACAAAAAAAATATAAAELAMGAFLVAARTISVHGRSSGLCL
eukprot:364927-Chlamydomonas_euryale.AAC.2